MGALVMVGSRFQGHIGNAFNFRTIILEVKRWLLEEDGVMEFEK
jgi:hypothetical protein